MNLWTWYRARRWWLKLLLASLIVPLGLLLLYVAGRSFQYAAAEKDAGAYVPQSANVVVRAKDLETHLPRIRESAAWRAFQRKVLRDPVLRREINRLLQANGAPTLDDLEDDRKPFARHQDRALHVLGSDAVATLQVRDSLPKAPFCGILRLRWLYYLATPLARLVLPRETIGDTTCYVVRAEGQEIRVAFVGALAIASNDQALLEQALRRKGREEDRGRPVEARVVFEGSPGLLQIRRQIQDLGAFPYVKWESARGLSASADVRDATVTVDAAFDRAEPLHPTPPPIALRSWAPLATSGVTVTNTGAADLIAWLRELITSSGQKDFVTQNALQALQTLDDGGLSSTFLPQLQDGMAVVTGVEERAGRAYTAFTLIFPARDAKAAIEAMNGLIRKIAGSFGDTKYFSSEQVGETTVYSWTWPGMFSWNDLLSPTYAMVKDAVIVGNNEAFTKAVIRTVDQADGLETTSNYRKLRARLKEEGFAAEPSLAGGMFYPPTFRESLDGVLTTAAKQMIYFTMNGAALRAEVIQDLSRGGRAPSEEEIGRAYNEAIERRISDQEAALRRIVQPMGAVRWAAYEANTGPKGISFRFAMEFR